ncbi:MAG: type I-E CRISPR-associated protein Cse1/CasA [Tomitella sp.]|nr:type I-E CRISPR-associated protein Cse1/CasA [Tomitella sp.]
MNLTTDAWIPVFTTAGMRSYGLTDVFAHADTVLDVASGDALEDAAIMRLLFACDAAADHARMTPADWVESQHNRFELFDPVAPFGQNPAMAEFVDTPRAARQVAAFTYRLVGDASTALGLTHAAAGIRLTPAQAARVLLVRQMFSVGGIQQFVASAFGKAAISAKTAVGCNRPLLWLQKATLAGSLAANRLPDTSGTFHFTWPNGMSPADRGRPDGPVDALTWLSRSILLLRDGDGMVAEAMCCDGIRFPEIDVDGWTVGDEQRMFHHTTWVRRKLKDPLAIQSVHPQRPPWRQILTAWADPDARGLLGQEAAADGTYRLAGLASYQARIDGTVAGTLPAPAFSREDGRALLEAVTGAYRSIASTAGSLAHNTVSFDSAGWSSATSTFATSGLADQIEQVVADACRTGDTASGIVAIDRIVADTCSQMIRDAGRVRPAAAARTASRPPAREQRKAPTA